MNMLIPIGFLFLMIRLGAFDSDIELMGKSAVTGRPELYEETIRMIMANPFDYVFGSIGLHRLTNSHNAPITIIANFGVLGYLLYWIFWQGEFAEQMNRTHYSNIQRLATFMLIAYMVHSSAEAGVMIGSVIYGLQLVIISRLAKDSFIDAQHTL